MKTKQDCFMKSALAVAAAFALSGCVKDATTLEKPRELRFVLNVAAPDEADTSTRALKPGWVSGDKIVVFFDANATQYAFFNYDGTNWDVYNDVVNTDAVNVAGGSLQAIHAGSSTFDFNGSTLMGVGGDLLYDQDGGTYTVDEGTNTAYVNLVMERGFTTAIKMQGSADQATNEKWRLAGANLWVMDPAKGTSITAANVTTNPVWAIQSLFSLSDAASGLVATPDAVFTDGTQAVFYVWDQSSAADGTSLDVYSTDDATTIYERDYTSDLAVGATTIVQAPDSSESGSWTGILEPITTAVALDGVTAPAWGATPAATVTSTSTDFTTAIAWNPADATFVAGTAYTATITLTSAAGKTFTGSSFITDDLASVASFTAGGMAPTGVTNTGDALVLTYAFAATPATIVTAAALTDVVAPEAGATPATTITTASTQFTAALAWDGSPATFAQGTAYTATITLTAATNYTFSGDFGDTATIAGFTVNGAAPTTWVSNDGTTLVFKYTFPATSANSVDYGAGGSDVTL